MKKTDDRTLMKSKRVNNIFSRRNSFIHRLFSFHSSESNSVVNEPIQPVNTEKKDTFVAGIKLYDEKESEILRLQGLFENNQIKGEDISDEELISLRNLYRKQIDSLEDSFARYKSQLLLLKKNQVLLNKKI